MTEHDTAHRRTQKVEIERRFLVPVPPATIDITHGAHVEQGYLLVAREGVTRIRHEQPNLYTLTVKQGHGLERPESEIAITADQFAELWPATERARIEKRRQHIPFGDHRIDFDVFMGRHAGLMIAEVEFPSTDAARTFVPPDWFGREVTNDPRYSNAMLAVHGLPADAARFTEPTPKTSASGAPRFDLNAGLVELRSRVTAHAAHATSKDPFVVTIAGGSVSGKTSVVAAALTSHFGDRAGLLSMDDYFIGRTAMEARSSTRGTPLSWDEPEAIDLLTLMANLSMLRQGETVRKPTYDFLSGERGTWGESAPTPIIILEGLFALHASILSFTHLGVFVDIGPHGRIMRRLLRDVTRTEQRPQDILQYFAEVVESMHEQHVLTTRDRADFIIENEYRADVEARASGLHEVQLKFPSAPSDEMLRSLGADRLGSVYQIDTYFQPTDRDLRTTGEILRIRHEGETLILTYKGPHAPDPMRKRSKFECVIDAETAGSLRRIYPNLWRTVEKSRTLYVLDGIVFSVDRSVRQWSSERGTPRDLGSFSEFRSTDHDMHHDHITEIMTRLGFSPNDGITTAYADM